MTRIPASGAMRWLDIQNSFGGSNPIGINEYYRTSTYVPDSDLNSNIPTSGQIEAADFRGADGFSGTSGSISAGTSGGKTPAVGYLAADYGSNLGTAVTSGSAGNGSFKFNIYQISNVGLFANIASTSNSPANVSTTAVESKTVTVTGNAGGAFTMVWTYPHYTGATNGDVPTSFGGGNTNGVFWSLGTLSGGSFANGTTYTFSIN
tara:strand:- start:1425 stop:2042 length:618 start_codon:yes stop_codon:yes gene_type:complete